MRKLLPLAVATTFSALLALSRSLHAQEQSICGQPPSLPTTAQNEESIKGQLQGQADFLSKLVGKAELSGQVEAARKQIYQSSDQFLAAQKDAYLAYVFCILITQDKSLSTEAKLKAVDTFKNSAPNKSGSAELPPRIALLGECRMSSLPITVPPHNAIKLILINPVRFKTTSWGLDDIPNDADQPTEWPPKEMMEKSRTIPPNYGVFIYQCEISNLGQINLVNVAIRMKFWFGNAGGGEQKGGEENAVKYDTMLSPLLAGQSARFYAVNDCNVTAFGVLPNMAKVKVAGTTTWQEVPLDRKFQNPIEQVMMFFPSSVRWIGGPCE
jgi:hypothetical protein